MKFVADDGRLIIRFEGIEMVLALQRKITIPREKITGIDWRAELDFPKPLWRLAGSAIPNILFAGRFRGSGQNYFLYLHRPQGLAWLRGGVFAPSVLIITTKNFPYRQLFLTCTPEIGEHLVTWWRVG